MATEKTTSETGRAAPLDASGRRAVDPSLLPFLGAQVPEESERLLAEVIQEQAAPVVEEVVRRKLRPAAGGADAAQVEDVRHDALVQVLEKLRRAKERTGEEPVGDLRAFAAAVAAHACHRHLRRKYPRRHMLKNRVRYLLTRQAGFALWEDAGGELVAGFEAWRGRAAAPLSDRLAELSRDPAAFVAPELLAPAAQQTRAAELLAAVFRHLDGPVGLDALVGAVAALWGVRDAEGEREEVLTELPAGGAGAGAELEAREYLSRLWAEVKELPARQRAALLLNLRDGRGAGCLALLPLLGVAGLAQIAAALEMPAPELAGMWAGLPLDDAQIAARLGLTRQQVINLRKSARARLARRLKGF